MARQIHLTGMGLTGSLLAHRLAQYGFQFTWSDEDDRPADWQADVGSIFPVALDRANKASEAYSVWQYFHQMKQFEPEHFEQHYCVTNKDPEIPMADVETDLPLVAYPSFSLNVQTFVPAMRRKFADRQLSSNPPAKRHIVTHGWGKLPERAVHQWTRLVRLETPSQFVGLRTSFLLNDKKGEVWAVPCPGTDWWYVGATPTITDLSEIDSVALTKPYENWRTRFERMCRGQVMVVEEGAFSQGWFPIPDKPSKDAPEAGWMNVERGRITCPAVGTQEAQLFPRTWINTAPLLGLVP